MIMTRLTISQFDRQDAILVLRLLKSLDDVGFYDTDASQIAQGDGCLRTQWFGPVNHSLPSNVVELQSKYDVRAVVEFRDHVSK